MSHGARGTDYAKVTFAIQAIELGEGPRSVLNWALGTGQISSLEQQNGGDAPKLYDKGRARAEPWGPLHSHGYILVFKPACYPATENIVLFN